MKHFYEALTSEGKHKALPEELGNVYRISLMPYIPDGWYRNTRHLAGKMAFAELKNTCLNSEEGGYGTELSNIITTIEERVIKLAPVFDCGSCLYFQMSEEKMMEVLDHPDEIDKKSIYSNFRH